MELRKFAERILESENIEDKLAFIEDGLTDQDPGDEFRLLNPARPPQLRFAGRKQAPLMPQPQTFVDPTKRAIAHHIMANHELQALEVMAFTLCAFPTAPSEFRMGLVRIMGDEQRHTRMHIERASMLGLEFGALPVNGYFWKKAQEFRSLLEYLAGLPLTFEGGNLDHTIEFAELFEVAGDARSAAVMRIIHRDEVEHVRFGLEWLRRLKPAEQSDWEAYNANLRWPLKAEKAKGKTFNAEPRRQAGMTEEFISELQKIRRTTLNQPRRSTTD